MLTVPEAARRVNRDPETVRRWIRSGKLRARKIGTQHVIEEDDLFEFEPTESFPLPEEWRFMDNGRPMPDVVRLIREDRASH